MQEGGTVDPVSGNEVPPGAMQEEVRDDIDAKLSEGEFVFPADVVRFIGLQTLMKLRDKAKMGLKRMNDIGQMGNAEEVEDGEALYGEEEEMDDETFSSEIDSIMGEEGGEEEREYAKGGYVVPENQELYRDAPIKGFEMVPMTNDAGQTIYIPFINGVAQLSIPAGYKVKKAGDTGTTPTTTTTPTTSGGDTGGGTGGDGGIGGEGGSGGGGGSNTDGSAKGGGQGLSNDAISAGLAAMAFGQSLAGKALSAITGVPASTISNTLGKAMSDVNLGKLGAAADALSQDTLGGQLATVSDESGNISTLSNDAITNAFDLATFGITSAGLSAEAAANAGYAAADAVGAEGLGVGNIGSLGFGTTGTDTGTDGVSSGDTGGLGFGTSGTDTGTDGTGAGTGDGGGGGVGAGDGGGGIGAGEGLAKGGFVSKPKKSNSKGLAGRRK